MVDIVVDYWSLNKTYIITTIIILIIFAYGIIYLNSLFVTEVASHGDCNDPLALYLNTGIRNKCMSTKQNNELKSQQSQFERDAEAISDNIDIIKSKIQETDALHDELQRRIQQRNEQKWMNVKQAITDLSGTVVSIQTKYRENKDALEKLINDYNNAIATNTELLVQVGNNLVHKLTKNIYTPNWSKQRANMVDAYNKIVDYLKLSASESNINSLPREAIKGKKQ